MKQRRGRIDRLAARDLEDPERNADDEQDSAGGVRERQRHEESDRDEKRGDVARPEEHRRRVCVNEEIERVCDVDRRGAGAQHPRHDRSSSIWLASFAKTRKAPSTVGKTNRTNGRRCEYSPEPACTRPCATRSQEASPDSVTLHA